MFLHGYLVPFCRAVGGDSGSRVDSNANREAAGTRTIALRAIVAAGLTAGILDIAAAICLMAARGIGPARLLQGIASGVLGPAAFTGGMTAACLGGFFHFLIALAAAAVFWFASRYFCFFLRHNVVCGAGFGIAVWMFMNLAVIPMSAVPPRPLTSQSVAIGLLVHVVCVGLPISLIVKRYSPQGS